MGFIVIIVLLFVFMWFFVLLPQRRRQAQQRSMLENVKPGDEIITAGGLYGDVTEVGEDEIAIEIAPGVEVRLATRAIAAVVPPDAYEEDEPEDETAAEAGEAADAADAEAAEAEEEATNKLLQAGSVDGAADGDAEQLPEHSAEPPAEAKPR